MSRYQMFQEWWSRATSGPSDFRIDKRSAEIGFEAALKLAEEKFNSQPTNQGREPAEIAPPVTCECCHEQPAVMNVCHDCYMAT